MKTNIKYTVITLLLLAFTFTGCAYVGKSPKPPTAFEQKLFTVETNQVPVTVIDTNGVSTVKQVETYTYHQSAEGQGAATVAGTITNAVAPGFGGAASAGVMAILSLWAYMRGTKFQKTSITIAQEVETMRTFIQSLPQGAKYDQAIVSYLQAHQIEAGVAGQVMTLLENQVSNPDAKAAVIEIHDALGKLTPATPTT